MDQVRLPAVAGTFYPANARDLQMSVDSLLAEAKGARDASDLKDAKPDDSCPKAIIAPHAGYVYSGSVAASVYARLLNPQTGTQHPDTQKSVNRVILMGPSHRVAFEGIAASSSHFFRTPLGDIPVDLEQIQKIVHPPHVGYLDEAHSHEHSLEVHLPFLQRALGDFKLVPLIVGKCSPEETAKVLDQLWGGSETLVVVSSDLSHYHEYQQAKRLDQRTSLKILQLSTDLVGEEACGCYPVNGLMYYAKQQGYRVEEIDLRNSGDTAGGTDRVVGYGSYTLTPVTLTPEASESLE